MKRNSPEKMMVIACIVIALGIYYMMNMKGCDCIKAEQIVPILATGIAIGVLLTSIKEWVKNRKQEKGL